MASERPTCQHCADLDAVWDSEPMEGTQAISAREYRWETGHWPSCPGRPTPPQQDAEPGEDPWEITDEDLEAAVGAIDAAPVMDDQLLTAAEAIRDRLRARTQREIS
jgi:hypothetical protein